MMPMATQYENQLKKLALDMRNLGVMLCQRSLPDPNIHKVHNHMVMEEETLDHLQEAVQ